MSRASPDDVQTFPFPRLRLGRVINNVSRDGPVPWLAGPFISRASHVNALITTRLGVARSFYLKDAPIDEYPSTVATRRDSGRDLSTPGSFGAGFGR